MRPAIGADGSDDIGLYVLIKEEAGPRELQNQLAVALRSDFDSRRISLMGVQLATLLSAKYLQLGARARRGAPAPN